MEGAPHAPASWRRRMGAAEMGAGEAAGEAAGAAAGVAAGAAAGAAAEVEAMRAARGTVWQEAPTRASVYGKHTGGR